MDPLSITAGIIAVLEVAGKVLLICYEYRFAVKNAPKELLRISEKVKSLRSVLETLEPLASQLESADSIAQAQMPALKISLAMCRDELSALEKKLTLPRLNGQPGLRKVLIWPVCWKLKEKDIEKTLATIESFFSLALSIDQRWVL